MHMHLLVWDNIWAGPWAGPSNPRAGPRNCRAGPYRARVSWVSLPCDMPGRAGSRLLKHDGPGRAGPGRFFFKQKTAYEIGVRLVGSEMCIRDRPMGRPICCPILKGAYAYADVFFCFFNVNCCYLVVLFPSGFRGTAAVGP